MTVYLQGKQLNNFSLQLLSMYYKDRQIPRVNGYYKEGNADTKVYTMGILTRCYIHNHTYDNVTHTLIYQKQPRVKSLDINMASNFRIQEIKHFLNGKSIY